MLSHGVFPPVQPVRLFHTDMSVYITNTFKWSPAAAVPQFAGKHRALCTRWTACAQFGVENIIDTIVNSVNWFGFMWLQKNSEINRVHFIYLFFQKHSQVIHRPHWNLLEVKKKYNLAQIKWETNGMNLNPMAKAGKSFRSIGTLTSRRHSVSMKIFGNCAAPPALVCYQRRCTDMFLQHYLVLPMVHFKNDPESAREIK